MSKESIYKQMLAMNGPNAYDPKTTVGPVTYAHDDHQGVDQLQIYRVDGGVFKAEGDAFAPKYAVK